MIKEAYYLLDPKVTKESPVIQELLSQFSSMLPSQFGKPYFVASPVTSLASVLRANCRNDGCSVRATVHVERDNDGILKIKEEEPIFDRQKNPCDKCKKLF